ncbi:MAG: hypothetical protein PVF59_08305 [Desulfobacterales bacterium]|jgi:hypothetical protein
MPIASTIDRSLRVVFTTADTVLTDQDWMRHHERLRNHPTLEADSDQLLDFRSVEACRLTPEVIRITSVQSIFRPPSRQAFVAVNNLTFGMCRMYEMLCSHHDLRIEVFRDLQAANEWLGLNAKDVRRTASNRLAVRPGLSNVLALYQTY